MKKMMLIGLMVVAAAGSVFASGNKEDEQAVPYGYGMGPRGGYVGQGGPGFDASRGQGRMYWADEEGNPVNAAELEEVTVEGTLVLETGTHPYLVQDGVNVFLMVPPFAISELELEGGEAVKVSGYELPEGGPMFWNSTDGARFLQVTSAEINGQTLTLQGGYGYGGAAYCDPSLGGRMGRAGGRGRW